MDLDQEFTYEGLENFFNPIEENPNLIEEIPTQNGLNIQVPITNVQEGDTLIKNQNPITDLPTNNQTSLLSPINPTPIAISTSSSNNQYYPISGVAMENQNFAIPPISSTPISIKNDQNRPATKKRSTPSPQARQTKRPASSRRPTGPPPRVTTVAGDKSPFGSAKWTEIFSFKLKPAGRFRDAIQALSDINLHPGGLALIEVDNSGFKVTVQNDSTKAMGVLHLKTELLTEFRCAKRFQKLCSGILDSILTIFSPVAKFQYEDVLTVSCAEGSLFLYFEFDGDLSGEASANIVEQLGLGDELRKWQPGNVSNAACVAVITTDLLKEIIPSLVHSDTVTVEMTSLNVMISIKSTGFSRNFEIPEGTGVPKGQKNCTEFKFPHGNSLKKACSLSQMFTVGIQNSPDSRVLLHFGIENLGSLLYIKPFVSLLINNFDIDELSAVPQI